MNCILCLQVIKTIKTRIDIFAENMHPENVEQIIRMHFWIEPDPNKHKYLCKKCWSELQTFHEFYIHIQECHRLLEQRLVEDTRLKDTAKIIEPATVRKRGRPSKGSGKLAKVNESVLSENLIINDEKEVVIPLLTESIKVEESIRNLEGNIDEEIMQEIASEEVKTIKPKDPINASPNELLEETEEKEVKIAEKRTRKKSSVAIWESEKTENLKTVNTEKKTKTKEADEYIREHFKLNCGLCEISMINFTELSEHFRQVHEQRHAFVKCCGKKLSKRCLLVDHLKLHRDPNYFKCSYCNKQLSNRAALENHIKIQHKSNEPNFECTHCKKRFFNRQVLNQHVLIHVPDEEKTVPCPKCEKFFPTKYSMNKHLRIVHLNKYAKVCHICGKLIRGGPSWMKWHIEEHAGVQREYPPCELCGAKIKGKYGLRRHMRHFHSVQNQTPQICTFCGKESATLTAHKAHVRYVHTMEPKHACTLCDKVFKKPFTLKEHMAMHTGERLYTCPHCPKTFNSCANMHSHRKKAHPKEFHEKRMEKFREMYGDSETTATNTKEL